MAGPMAISFGFSRKREVELKTKSAIQDDDLTKIDAGPDLIVDVRGNKIKSTLQRDESELIIPLIQSNKWRLPDLSDDCNGAVKQEEKQNEDQGDDDSLDAMARREVLREAALAKEDADGGETRAAGYHGVEGIPLILQNKVPEGYETDDKLDVSIRPEEPTSSDYESIPVEKYGMAMLKGMGWKPGKAVGKRNKNAAAPVEVVLRPKGLGLGADRSAAKELEDVKKRKRKPGDSKESDEESLEMKKGANVKLLKGPHKDLYGKVDGIDGDTARVVVRLTVSSQMVSISELSVKVVPRREFEKFSKYINQGKVEEYKQKQQELLDARLRQSEDTSENGRQGRSGKSRDVSPTAQKKFKKRDEEGSQQHSNRLNGSQNHMDGRKKSWLRPHLRVRFIDRNYKHGKFYNAKLIIEDVVGRDACLCKTDMGQVIDSELPERHLETVIPRCEGAHVMVVAGDFSGQIGRIISKDKSKCVATIQLVTDPDVVMEKDYDDVCEFVGNVPTDD